MFKFIRRKFNEWFPRTPVEVWGYYPRQIGKTRWLFGKVERHNRVIFPKFITVWAWGDTFVWGLFRDFESDAEFNRVVLQALFREERGAGRQTDMDRLRSYIKSYASPTSEDDENEAIEALSTSLDNHGHYNPFNPRSPFDQQEILELVAARKGRREDVFAILDEEDETDAPLYEEDVISFPQPIPLAARHKKAAAKAGNLLQRIIARTKRLAHQSPA